MAHKLLTAIFIMLLFPAIALADDPETENAKRDLTTQLGSIIANFEDFQDKINFFADLQYDEIGESMFGSGWLDMSESDRSLDNQMSGRSLDNPGDDLINPTGNDMVIPDEFKELAVTFEVLANNSDGMTTRDKAQAIGKSVAFPILLVRGLFGLGGPFPMLSIYVSTLLFYAVWVTFVEFSDFLVALIRWIISLISDITGMVRLFKP